MPLHFYSSGEACGRRQTRTLALGSIADHASPKLETVIQQFSLAKETMFEFGRNKRDNRAKPEL